MLFGGASDRTPPAPSLGFASHFPLPLKGVRDFAVQRSKNGQNDLIQIGHDVIVGETDDAVAELAKCSSSSSVISFPVAMRVAVNFYHQPFRAGGKVGDVRREDDLALEFHSEAVGAKDAPQPAFCGSEIGAQLLCASSRVGVPFHDSPLSLPLRGIPLLLKGVRGIQHAPNQIHESPIVNA